VWISLVMTLLEELAILGLADLISAGLPQALGVDVGIRSTHLDCRWPRLSPPTNTAFHVCVLPQKYHRLVREVSCAAQGVADYALVEQPKAATEGTIKRTKPQRRLPISPQAGETAARQPPQAFCPMG